ncbi:DMT family transporter [Legionella dresdenensis]|uniref:DMT family transporter n=1 Tax=Legionella dresdenensis TaxID=450200 RepID=A0ABV8CDD3_9GAMM
MIFLFLAQTMVGINIVSSKLLVSEIPVLLLLTIRFSLATFILLPLHWLTPDKKLTLKNHFASLQTKDYIFLLAQALTAGVMFNTLMLSGLNYTDANIAGIITSTLPAIIAVMAWIVLKEKFTGKQSLCIVFATAGLIVIATDKVSSVTDNNSFFGDLLVFLSLFPEATYYILCKLHPNKLPVFIVSALMNGINALLVFPSLLFINWNLTGISLIDWAILFILGLSSGLFYVFWYFGCQRVDGLLTSLSTAVMPIATVIFAWIILGEKLTILECLGMGLVIFSIVLYAKR